jgi:hypothetical protein
MGPAPPVIQKAFLAVAQRSLQNRVSMPVFAAIELISSADMRAKLDGLKSLDPKVLVSISVAEYRDLLLQAIQGLPPPP